MTAHHVTPMAAATGPETRPLPHNLDAEKAVLGVALASRGAALDTLSDLLRPEDFFRDAHRRIYAAMLALYARGAGLDFITLQAELERRKDLGEVGGPAYVAGLGDGFPVSTNVAYYARLVKETYAKREVIDLASRLLRKAYDPDGEPGALVEEAEQGLLRISEQAEPGDLVSSAQMVDDIFPVIESLQTEGRELLGLSTGLPDLDRYTLGLQRGGSYILAGKTSHGKTSLAMQVALHAAKTAPVAFFSVEMAQREQMFRIISTLAKVDGHKLKLGRLNMIEQQALGPALSDFAARRFWHDDSAHLTPLRIRSRARRLKAKHGLGLIVVDYLQILTHAKAERRDLAIAQTSRTLKQIARELDVPVIVLSQLNRGVDGRKDQKPQLSDLRESGAIEQDADVVLLIYRPPEESDGMVKEQPPTQLIIAKQRNGPTAEIDLVWLGEQYRFAEVENRA